MTSGFLHGFGEYHSFGDYRDGLRSIPPAAAESLKKKDGIGEKLSFALHAGDRGLQKRRWRSQKRLNAVLAALDLLLCELEAARGGTFGGGRGRQALVSACSARNASATFWNAVSTTPR